LTRLTLFLASALALAYTGWILLFPVDPATESAVSSVLIVICLCLTALIGGNLLHRADFPAELRGSWILICLAALAQTIAESIWFYNQTILQINPFPSLADLFYILYYLFLIAAVWVMPFTPPRQKERALMVLDITIVMTVASLFMYYFVLASLLEKPEPGGFVAILISFTYPCADLLILAALFTFLQREIERVSRMVILFLSASLFLTFLADIGWLVSANFLSLYTPIFIDWLWTLAALAMLLAIGWQASHSAPQELSKPMHFRPLLRDLALYLATGSAFVLILVSVLLAKISDPRILVVTLLTVALGVLVMFRQYLLLVENQRLYREMERLATFDQLTGLHNRRAFDLALESEARRAERFNHPYSILMMDIDNFKNYNARFGHLGGDVMLQRVANLLSASLRTTDFLARFGGDEFVAILPETDQASAQQVAEKIMAEANDYFNQDLIGISVGAASWKANLSALEVVDQADQRLYKIKATHASR
jgi:diguanylate cyclase (GGDEF)-like protein